MKKICLIIICVLFSVGCYSKNEMNQHTFWQLMDVAREKAGSDMVLRYDTLVALLAEYETIDILRFRNIAEVYMNAAADNKGIWAACRVMEGSACDDIYGNFCCWLITEGKETYLKAVKNPESLATEEIRAYSDRGTEILSFATFDAFQRKTGKHLEEIANADADILADERKQLSIDLLKNIDFWDDTPFVKDRIEAIRQIPGLLPKLTAMFGYDAEADIREAEFQ